MQATRDTSDGDGIFSIPEANMPKFQAAIEKLSKKSIKLTGESIEPVVFGYSMLETSPGIEIRMYDVLLGGIAPKLNGWEFIAKIDHTHGELGNILRSLPGKNVPEKYRNTGCICEHCNVNRYRRDTFLLQNIETQEVKQVGSTCLKDFLGHEHPEALAKRAELLSYLNTMALGFASLPGEGIGQWYLNLETYLTYAAISVRDRGYFVSKTKSNETGVMSTSVAAFMMITASWQGAFSVTDADVELAQKSIEWAQNLGEDGQELNDFHHNLKVLAAAGSIETKSMGYATSILGSYIRATEKKAEQAALSNEFLGTPGTPFTSSVTLKSISPTSNDFGDGFLYLFTDISGNVLKWFTAKDIKMSLGTLIGIKCKVKKHEAFKGKNSTIVTHCKFE